MQRTLGPAISAALAALLISSTSVLAAPPAGVGGGPPGGFPGGGLQSACASFGNLGNCMSALHVARNLSLSGGFDALKQLMTTGSKLPLGKAIIQLDPKADAKLAESAARKQARAELRHADAEASGN